MKKSLISWLYWCVRLFLWPLLFIRWFLSMCSIIPPGPPGVPKSPPRVNIKYLPLLVIDHCFRVKYQLISYKISSSFKCIYQTKSGFRCIYQMTSARHQMSLNKMKYLDLGSLLYYSFGRYNPPGTRPFRCLQYIPMACVLFPFVKMKNVPQSIPQQSHSSLVSSFLCKTQIVLSRSLEVSTF